VAKRGTAPRGGAGGRRGLPLLTIAWTLLILILAGDAVWQALGGGAPEPRTPAEPFYLGLEPPEPPRPPAPQGAAAPDAATTPQSAETPAPPEAPPSSAAMPPMAPAQDVPQVVAKPPEEPAAPAKPNVPMPAQAPKPRPGATTGGTPAATAPAQASPQAAAPAAPAPAQQQTAAAVVPPQPAMPGAAAPSGALATWQKFATPFDYNDARPRIAVIIVDLGLSSAATEAAIQTLPPGVTLSFSPYAENLDNWLNLARAGGHEALLGLPMEPANFPTKDPGPRALLTSLSPRENLDRLNWVLGRVSGYVGVINNQGSRFTASADALRPVLVTLRDRGLMFVDARTSPRSVAASLASQLGLPRAINDRQIDQQAARAAIDAMLADVEKVARETGNAVAMGQPYPVTFERLAAWIPSLEGKGFALAPITAMVNRQPDS
jgi:uncharacterized protein